VNGAGSKVYPVCRVHASKFKLCTPKGEPKHRESNMGWLHIFYHQTDLDANLPSRKYYVDHRDIGKITDYWEGHVVGDLKWEFKPDANVLKEILR